MTGFESFMSGAGWAVFAFAAAVFFAGIVLINQYARLRGDVLMFWLRLCLLTGLSPVAFLISWPESPYFYVAVALTVLCAIPSDVRVMNVCAKYGGGVAARIQALVVWLSFFLWFAFDPGLFLRYAERPLNTAVILLALGGCVYFARRQNHCLVSRAALVDMLPALAGYAATAVLNKYAMMQGPAGSTVYCYIIFQSALAVPFLAGLVHWQGKKTGQSLWLGAGVVRAAGLAALVWMGHMVFKNYSMAYIPNPAYQAAINLSAPLFVALFYLAVKHREEGDVKNGMGVVVCAVLLALAAVR